MKVSVVTVCFRAESTVAEAAKSVLSQKGVDLEYIIIDGASDDGTLEALEPLKPQISLLVSEPDRGLYDAMNKGLAQASGELITFLNADDFYTDPHVLSDVVKTFNESSSVAGEPVDGVYADLDIVHPQHTDQTVRLWRSGTYKPGHFRKGWMPPHPTLVVKTAAMKTSGGFNLELKSAADYEFMLRCFHLEHRALAYLPRTTVRMRAGGVSNSSFKNRLRANAEDARAWRLNGAQPPWHLRLSKPLRKLSQFF